MRRAHEAPRIFLRDVLLLVLLVALAAFAPHVIRAWPSGSPTVTPAMPDVIHACYIPSSGTMYRIKATDPSETCKSPQHVEFHWNVQGPPGADGADGADGVDGVSGYEVLESTVDLPQAGAFELVLCPVGKRVLGGGYSVLDPSGGRTPHVSRPVGPTFGNEWGWSVSVVAGGDGTPATLTVFAICASVPVEP